MFYMFPIKRRQTVLLNTPTWLYAGAAVSSRRPRRLRPRCKGGGHFDVALRTTLNLGAEMQARCALRVAWSIDS